MSQTADRPSPPHADAGLPPRCCTCAYVLTGLPSPGECPECGRWFHLDEPATYTIHPPFIGWVFWLPGLLLSGIGGVGLMGLLAFGMGNWGAALWFGVPITAGMLLGYRYRSRLIILPVLIFGAGAAVIVGMMSMSLGGVFCGLILWGLSLAPLGAGALAGSALRHTLKRTGYSQRSYLPVLAMLAAPVLWAVIEGPPPVHAPETVSTEVVIEAPADALWAAIQFYEDVKHDPPLLLRIGLVRPLRTEGAAAAVGDVKVCIYNRGRISKRITEVRPPTRLAFQIVEQQIGYECDARLLGGSFELIPEGPRTTRVRLTTAYEPRMTPRWAWRPGERYAIGLLHRHVLEGMALDAAAREGPSVSMSPVPFPR